MIALRPQDGIYLGDGEWLSLDHFGDLDPDERQDAHLPVLEWEDAVLLRFPHAALADIRQLIRLLKASEEYHDRTGRYLDVYGAIGELYGAVVWDISLHHKMNAQGSDGRLGNDFVEIKTIGPKSRKNETAVKMSGNFSQLLVVKVGEFGSHEHVAGVKVTGRLVRRGDLGGASTGKARIAWCRACQIGAPPPM